MVNKVKIASTSRTSARVDDIELRVTQTTRLIFRPLLVDNAQNRQAAVKGALIFQRKRPGQDWGDHKELSLSQLKAEQWVKLELDSAETLKLFQELAALYELYGQEGIPKGEVEYYRADAGLGALLAATDEEIEALEKAPEALARLLRLSLSPKMIRLSEALEKLDTRSLQDLTSLVGLRTLRASLELWEENKQNSYEEFWQETLSAYAFVLSQVFAYPAVIIKGKAYVGGKTVENVGGNLVDFLLQNKITRNVVLVEIKTPITPLLGPRYRDNVYSISKEISGAVVQVSNYRYTLLKEYSNLHEALDFYAFEPACVVIAGNFAAELDDETKRRSFELFRAQLRSVQLITYDELFGKVELLIGLLEGSAIDFDETTEEEGDIPF